MLVRQGQEIIGAGDPDHAADLADIRTGLQQICPVRHQHHGVVGARRMSGQEQPRRIAAISGGMGADIGESLGAVLKEIGVAHLRKQPVIRHRDHDAFAGKGLAKRQIEIFAPAFPRAAIEEQDHRHVRRRRIGHIQIQPLAGAAP